MSALPAWPLPATDPRSPDYVDTLIVMEPERPRAPASILQSTAQRRANASRDRLLATLRRINRTPEETIAAAGARVSRRFFEFFAVNVRNRHTRRAQDWSAGQSVRSRRK